MNASFKERKFQKDWKSVIVVPVCSKSGDLNDVSNYRPISILPIISKIAEKFAVEPLTTHLNSSPYTLHPMHLGFGFGASHSTDTANYFYFLFFIQEGISGLLLNLMLKC